MRDIYWYVKENVRTGKLSMTEQEKAIIQKLVDFYFGDIEVENLKRLNKERINVERFLKVRFYKELKLEIDKQQDKRDLKEQERIANVITMLLSDEVKSFDDLSKISGVPIREIKRIISKCDDITLNKINEKLVILKESEKQKNKSIQLQIQRTKKLKKYDTFIYVYLNSRYRADDLDVISDSIKKHFINDIINNDFAQYYPEDVLEQLRIKGDELKKIKVQRRQDCVVVRDVKLIELVKPCVTRVTPYMHSILELVLKFFEYFGNIEKMVEDIESIPNYNSILSSLMIPELENYLTEEAYIKLQKYLGAEQLYHSLNYADKLVLVRNIFLKYSGNLYTVIKNKNNEELILRMLSDKLIKRVFGEELYNKTCELLEEYKEKRYVIDELEKAKVKSLM